MDVNLYVTTSDREKLTKALGSTKTYSCVMKDTVNVLRPTVRIQTADNLSGYNYARIERYGRYYYVNAIRTTPNGYWEIDLEVDPLMSYADDIKRCYGTITRSEDIFNGYIVDEQYQTLSYKKYVTKKFPTAIDNDCFILMTVG